jgi:hypothetical protein
LPRQPQAAQAGQAADLEPATRGYRRPHDSQRWPIDVSENVDGSFAHTMTTLTDGVCTKASAPATINAIADELPRCCHD